MLQNMRVVTKIHIGAQSDRPSIGPDGVDLLKDNVHVVDLTTNQIEINGQMVKLSALPALVKTKWLVPEEDVDTIYIPQSTATSTYKVSGEATEAKPMEVVSHTKDVTPAKARVSALGDSGADGKTVGKVKATFKANQTIDSSNIREVQAGVDAKSRRVPFVDLVNGVEEGVGQTVRVATKPKSRPIPNPDGIILGETVDTVRTGAEGVHMAPVVRNNTVERYDDLMGDRIVMSNFKTRATPQSQHSDPDLSPTKVSQTTENLEQILQDPPRVTDLATPKSVVPNTSNLSFLQKLALIQTVVPNFRWDLTRPWQVRVADAVNSHSKDSPFLIAVMAVETDNVKKHILMNLKH